MTNTIKTPLTLPLGLKLPNCKLGVLSALVKTRGIDSTMANAYHADLKQTETV